MGNKNSKSAGTGFGDKLQEGMGEQVGRYVETVLGFGEKRLEELEKLAKEKDASSGTPDQDPRAEETDKTLKQPPPDSVLGHYKVWQLKELGLGRGVDGTNPRPWVNKSSFQVRNPIIQLPNEDYSDLNCNLACTDDGGLVQDFLSEVTTIKEQAAKIELSITVPNTPVTVGTGADLSRKLTTKQNAYGKRVYSETIAFKPVADWKPEIGLASEVMKAAGINEMDKKDEEDEGEQGEQDKPKESAEAGIEEPIKNLLEAEPAAMFAPENMAIQAGPGYFERRLLERFKIKEEDTEQTPAAAFYNFLKRYRVTHYVSSITMGASAFIVESESNSDRTLKLSGNAGYAPVISTKEASLTFTKKVESKSRDIQQVGEFKKDDKGKLTYEIKKKAVVEVKLEPLYSLFRDEKLREAMQTALTCFTEEEKRRKEGPFLISCGDGSIFWKVTEDQDGHAHLFATTNRADTSEFYILLTDENNEFYIGWQKPQKDMSHSTMRYLKAAVSPCGRNNGPLCFGSRGEKQNSLFSINPRFGEAFYILPGTENVNPEIWFDLDDSTRESFLLRCIKRKARVDGFVAMARNPDGAQEDFRSITRTNARGHDDGTVYMAFRLHKQKYVNACFAKEPSTEGSSRACRPPAVPGDGVNDTSL